MWKPTVYVHTWYLLLFFNFRSIALQKINVSTYLFDADHKLFIVKCEKIQHMILRALSFNLHSTKLHYSSKYQKRCSSVFSQLKQDLYSLANFLISQLLSEGFNPNLVINFFAQNSRFCGLAVNASACDTRVHEFKSNFYSLCFERASNTRPLRS